MPALEEFTEGTLANPRSSQRQKIETAYLLARLRAAMKQRLPAAYIREPDPQWLANAAKSAKSRPPPAT